MEFIISLAIVVFIIVKICKTTAAKEFGNRLYIALQKFLRAHPELVLNERETRYFRKHGKVKDFPEEEEESEIDFASLRNNNRLVSSVILGKVNEVLQNKFGYSLDTTERNVLLAAFLALPDKKINKLCNYIKEHPFISMWLVNQLAELHNKKRANGEHINAAEIAMFIYTAKTLGGE